MNDVIPYEVIIRGDSRNERLSLEFLQQELAELRLTPAAPPVVAHEIFIAKRVFLAGWFFYELFADSFHHSAVACESALRERFVRDLPLPIELEAKRADASGQRTTRQLIDRPEADTLDEMLRRAWRLRTAPDFRMDYSRLIGWAEESGALSRSAVGYADHFRQWRNMSAHGSKAVLPPGPLLNVMQESIWIINELFPDPTTDAYDAPRKAALRAAQDAEHDRRIRERAEESKS
jgi:hypothetical protein